MRKSNIITILAIFILPLALYYFFKMPSENNVSFAINGQNKPMVLQFTSAMCYDCKRIKGEIKSLKQEYKGRIIFKKINIGTKTEDVNKLIEKYSITVVPTLVFLDENGNVTAKKEAYLTREQIKKHLDRISNGKFN